MTHKPSFWLACAALSMSGVFSCTHASEVPAPTIPNEVIDAQLAPLVHEVSVNPEHAGSWLDLALRLCQKGKRQLTNEVLNYIEQSFSPPTGIMEVITLMRQSGCDAPMPNSAERQRDTPRISLSAQRGRDSNVNQGASSPLLVLGSAFPGVVIELTPEFLPVGDQFTALDAGINVDFGSDFRGSALVRTKHHDNQHRFDTGIALGNLEQAWSCGAARCVVSGALGAIGLADRLYQTLGQIQIGLTIPLVGSSWPQALTMEAMLGRQVFATQPSFNAWLAQARASWRVLLGGTDLLQLSLAVGRDEPTAGRPGGSRRLSTLGASGGHDLGSQFTLDWNVQRQITQDSKAYSPGLIDMARHPVLDSLVLGLTRPVAELQRVRLEFRYINHRDVVSLFTYRNKSVSLSWLWDFSL
ncbi:MAG: hypothetical protein V4738_03885 [Pseudomonadota bacterium]